MSAIPKALRNSLAALAILAGSGGGMYMANEATIQAAQNEYLQEVATDHEVSDAVKIAMVMANFYESSNRHIGTPYVDRNGKGQPLTVCNGITGAVAKIDPNHYYTPAECYAMEKRVYLKTEQDAMQAAPGLIVLSPMTQATFIDFIHNHGISAFRSSTMLRKLNAGDVSGACRENPRWTRGTVGGVSRVLPGLVIRKGANAEICEFGL